MKQILIFTISSTFSPDTVKCPIWYGQKAAKKLKTYLEIDIEVECQLPLKSFQRLFPLQLKLLTYLLTSLIRSRLDRQLPDGD